MTPLKNFILSGGIFMIPMVICSLVGLTIILERTFALRRKRVISDALVSSIRSFKAGDDIQRLYGQASGDVTVLGHLVQTTLSHLDSIKSETMEAVQIRARAEAIRLERGFVTLEIIVGIGPLLGLLGTVSGLIQVFAEFGQGSESFTEASRIAAGISEALNMTVAGLIVAIPALVVHAYYSRRVELYMTSMEGICLELISKLYKNRGTDPGI